jgi:hypothetical protein
MVSFLNGQGPLIEWLRLCVLALGAVEIRDKFGQKIADLISSCSVSTLLMLWYRNKYLFWLISNRYS